MRMRRTFATIIAISGLILGLESQSFAGNSIYSRLGIGLPRYTTTIGAAGMGGAGIATLDRSTLHYMNPAALSFYSITRFDGSGLLERNRVALSDQTGEYANSNFYSFQVAIPVKQGWGIGLGLLPYTQVSYSLTGPVNTTAYQGEQSLEGRGALTHGFLRLGGSLGSRLVFGVGLDVYFGRIERIWKVDIETIGFRDTRDVFSYYMRGLGASAGVVIRPLNTLNVGAVVSLPASLQYTSNVTFSFGPSTDIADGTLQLPLSQGVGVSFYPSEKWLLAADVYLQKWSEVEGGTIFGARTTDVRVVATGIEFTPTTDQNEGIFRRMSYRVGVRLSNLPYLDDLGEVVEEQVVTFGFTLPYYFYRSKIDFAFEFGRRGKLGKNYAEENVFRMVVGITSGEKWFER